jgi:hypothetical protein
MDSHVFDIILIILAVVILLHLFYNNSLFVSSVRDSNEHMSHNKRNATNTDIKMRNDAEYRDNGTRGIDRTKPSKKWYHVANKIVDNAKTKKTSKKVNNTKSKKTSKKVNKYFDNEKNNEKNNDKNYDLTFGSDYEGRLTSDPYEVDMQKHPETMDHKGFDNNNPNEKYEDVNGKSCTLAERSANMKRYIRDYVLDGKSQCECVVDKSKSDFTRNEVDEYRDQQIEFRNKTYGTSAPAVDPVDKMNTITMQGGIKGNNQTIADFYDNIVGGSHNKRISNLNGPGFIMGSSIPTNKCVEPPHIDTTSGIPQGFYTGSANAGGKYFMRDNWMYNNENPNNGGALFDGIQGEDPMLNIQRML